MLFQQQQLIEKVRKLEAHVTQLRNVIKKSDLKSGKISKKYPNQRKFDFSKHSKRHVALKFLYFGWDYHGFVIQEDSNNTIENHIFDALIKSKLIESRETSNYHRCGRTDAGVSAFCQVISIDVRSNLMSGKGVIPPDVIQSVVMDQKEDVQELNYCKMLNRLLPNDIKFISWAPVNPDFSSRFNCQSRCYYYFFPKGNLDIELMKDAAKHLIGEHDYRNFCKIDPKLEHFIRGIKTMEIEQFSPDIHSGCGYEVMVAKIVAKSFLWHQIRCIMSILFMVGEKKELPDITLQLLDVQKNYPHTPHYSMAIGLPLVLFECEYDTDDINEWISDPDVARDVVIELQNHWSQHMMKTQMIRSMIDSLNPNNHRKIFKQNEFLNQDKTIIHVPLEKRPTWGKLI